MRVPGLGRASARLRLTIGYSALFLVGGAALLAVSYLLVSNTVHRKGTVTSIACGVAFGRTQSVAPSQPPVSSCIRATGSGGVTVGGGGLVTPASLPPPSAQQQFGQLREAVSASQSHTLHALLIESGVALGLLTIVSVGFGWWFAGRVLRPVHRITDTARRLSEQTLHDRINMDGPRDELKELADTFDAMLARLDRAFSSQRRFVANASHELRTPLATERVLIDEALANRAAGTEDFRAILEQLRVNSEDTERLIDALLMLARSERGIERRERVDVATIGEVVVARAQAEAVTVAVDLRGQFQPATTVGDKGLLERLAGNMVENGMRHNHPDGWVTVATSTDDGWAILEVANSGRVLDPEAVPALVEPFRREGPDRTSDRGFGLGLSIIHAIVTAHGGRLSLDAPQAGGLVVVAALPSAPPGFEEAPDLEERESLLKRAKL